MKEKIITLYERGFTQVQISEILHVSVTKIQQIIKETPQVVHPEYGITSEVKEAIKQLIEAGLKQKQISEILDISLYTVKDIVKASGKQHKSQEVREKEEKEKCEILHKLGLSKEEIAKEIGLSKKTVSKILKQEDNLKVDKIEKKKGISYPKEEYPQREILMYERGYGYLEICKNMKCEPKDKLQLCKSIEKTSMEKHRKSLIERIQAKRKEKTLYEISKEIRIPVVSIKIILDIR